MFLSATIISNIRDHFKMNPKIQLLFFTLIVLFHRTNGLYCYSCISSTSIYNKNCDTGSGSISFGMCPSNFKYCIEQRFNFTDGSRSVLRDCAISAVSSYSYEDQLNFERQGKQLTSQRTCGYDLCNGSSAIVNQSLWISMLGAVIMTILH